MAPWASSGAAEGSVVFSTNSVTRRWLRSAISVISAARRSTSSDDGGSTVLFMDKAPYIACSVIIAHMWNVMLRCTMVLMVALTRSRAAALGFPSLSGGPEAAPDSAVRRSRLAAPAASSQLQQEQAGMMAAARAEAERETVRRASVRCAPEAVLAALPLAYAETMPEGVIGRAIESAQASRRSLVIVGVGAGTEGAVSALTSALEARGVRVHQEVSADEAHAPSRVDLYLGA